MCEDCQRCVVCVGECVGDGRTARVSVWGCGVCVEDVRTGSVSVWGCGGVVCDHSLTYF